MQILDQIKAAVLEELGQYDIAAPTLDPRFRLLEAIEAILIDESEGPSCMTCGACFPDECDACIDEGDKK